MRLIDADALLLLIQDEYAFYKEQYDTTEIEDDKAILVGMAGKLLWCKNKVRNALIIDAVEVIRCKDCQHQKTCDHARRLGIYGYCSDGERRETS